MAIAIAIVIAIAIAIVNVIVIDIIFIIITIIIIIIINNFLKYRQANIKGKGCTVALFFLCRIISCPTNML